MTTDDRTPAPPTPAATVEQTVNEVAYVIWQQFGPLQRHYLAGETRGLFHEAARAVLCWAAAHPAAVQAVAGQGESHCVNCGASPDAPGDAYCWSCGFELRVHKAAAAQEGTTSE